MAAHLPGRGFESLPKALFLSHLYFSPLFLNDFDQVKVLLSGPVKDNPAPHALHSLPPPHPNLSTGVVPNICSCDLARLLYSYLFNLQHGFTHWGWHRPSFCNHLTLANPGVATCRV